MKWILAFGIVSTAAHFSHNFAEIDRYPDDLISGEVIQAAILVGWPLFTGIGLLGYWLYSNRRYPPAHACLLAYSSFCLTSLGHFLDGSPDIPAFWYATIFTDGLAGLGVLAFTVRSARASVPAGESEAAPQVG